MSSVSEQSRSQSSDEPFQSAQRLPNVAVDDEDSDLASESLSSTANALNPKQPIQETGSAFLDSNRTGADDTAYESAQEASSNGQEQALPASPPLPSRPNKHRGPASTWRNWTAPERELIASLDQLTAKDLSVHLYNIFKLKKKSVKQESQVPNQDEGGDDADMYDADSWVPPRVWTAWPLAPEAVPREQEQKKWVEGIILPPYIVRPKLPGNILRELLEAEILRKARLKFGRRAWVDIDDEDDGNESTNLKPVIMADDERASKILRPTIHTILGRLDALLIGLHRSGNASLAFDDSGNESQSQTRVRSISQPRSRKRKRMASGTDSEQAMTVSETDTSFASKSRSRLRGRTNRSTSLSQTSNTRHINRRKSRLAVRDWSDILGVASMTGWEPAVVDKAASRCASLFKECITFRTLKEGYEGYDELPYKPGASTPLLASKMEGIDQKVRKAMLGAVHLDGFLEPIEGKKSWKYQGNRSGRGPERPQSKG